jgi:hypothetical protein
MTAEPTYGPDGPEYTMDVLGTYNNPIRVVLIPLARGKDDVRRGEVVFYDQRYAPWKLNAKIFSYYDHRVRDSRQGQFMGAFTLGGPMGFLEDRENHHGLSLDDGIPSWSIDGAEMIPLMKWIRRRCFVAGTELN